jgi:carbamate kinase
MLPLTVVALGGNAISPPRGDLSIAAERQVVASAAAEVAAVARRGSRLLVVHGNGPQVGRLLTAPHLGDPDAIDVHVAQTQGELGYLLAEALEMQLGGEQCAAIVTRVLVAADDPAFAQPTKPVGAVLRSPPAGVPAVRVPDGDGWRRVVASPRPLLVVEQAAIAAVLPTHHVVAAGGGGVALIACAGARQPRPAVIDKDWVAALLAVGFNADGLLFVTDVPHAFDRFGTPDQQAIHTMRIAEARDRLADGVFAPGSMAPKVESAVQFVEATGRPAVIATVGHVAAALAGTSGTTIRP